MTETADFVVIGGGSGGCTLAGRLSEDSRTSVALLEAGGKNDSLIVKTPAALVLMVASKLNNWAFKTEPQKGLNGRRGYQPRGKGLGGSSAINAMVYIRGHRTDYDQWAALGNNGWSYDEVLPYFIKAEDNDQFRDKYHGVGGPLAVSQSRTGNPMQQTFLQAAREAQFPIQQDFNGADQEGLGVFQMTQKNGERWSAARAYIHPHMGRRNNLRVKTGAVARRIIFEGKRAVGVEYKRDDRVQVIRANREVILACGTFQSPQLLMLSGIGERSDLAEFGINVVNDLPGVGRNLQDHPDFIFGYTSDNPNLTGASPSTIFNLIRAIGPYRREGRGRLTSNFGECGGFLKTRPDLNAPDIQLHLLLTIVDDHGRKLHWNRGYGCHVCVLRPKSRGRVWLGSKDPNHAPLIDPNFLGEEEDLETMVAAFKLTRRLMETQAMRSMRNTDVFTAGVESDDDIRKALREGVDTVYHPVGSCRMGIDDRFAVVDPMLRVYGVQGLRIVDASIMPTLVGGNTNAPTIMIAEKAADMIKAEMRA